MNWASSPDHRETTSALCGNDIDYTLMMSKDFDDLLGLLKESGYEIKHGKYISVKPENGGSFIRLKSLGEYYSKQALRNRLLQKAHYEQQLAQKVADAKKRSAPNAVVLRTMQFTRFHSQ